MLVITFICIAVVLLAIWHKKYQIPTEYILIKGEIESYQSASPYYINKRLIESIDIFSLSKAKKVVFHTLENKRIAFTSIFYKNALWRQLGNYHPNTLVGNFCLMKQHGKVYFIAFQDNNKTVAVSSDLYFPLSLTGKISFAIRLFFGLVLFYIPMISIGFILLLGQREAEEVGSAFILTFPIVYGYFLYFNLFSKYSKDIYKKQIELLKDAGISEPII